MNELRLEKSNEEEVIWRDIRSFNRRPEREERQREEGCKVYPPYKDRHYFFLLLGGAIETDLWHTCNKQRIF